MLPKRATFALIITAAALALLLNFKTPETPATTSYLAVGETAPTSTGGATGGTTTGQTTGSTAGGSTTSTTSTTSGGLKAGTYTGNAVSIGYGTVQVQITVASGKLSNVSILQYPTSGRSGQIAQNSLPTLISESLQAQSAQISAVSGATFTSHGYMQSLQSALDQAHA